MAVSAHWSLRLTHVPPAVSTIAARPCLLLIMRCIDVASSTKTEQQVSVLLDILEDTRTDRDRLKNDLACYRELVTVLESRASSLLSQLREAQAEARMYKEEAQKQSESSVSYKQLATTHEERCQELQSILDTMGYKHPRLPPVPEAQSYWPEDVQNVVDTEDERSWAPAQASRIPGFNCSQESQSTALWRVITKGAPQ